MLSMKNLKIRTRIAMALALPVMGLLFFSISTLIDKRQTGAEMKRLQELAGLAPAVSALVHELQKERGTSAVYLGSKGTKYVTELPEQWKQTSDRLDRLRKAVAAFDTVSFGARLPEKAEAAKKALAKLDKVRKSVRGQSTTVPKMASYYTPTIAKLLAIVEEMAVISTNARVTKAIMAYTALLQGKERAGLERAMGGAGFGAGGFNPVIYKTFLELMAKQVVFLGTFDIYATKQQRDFLRKTVTGPDVDEVDRMRRIAIENPTTKDVKGITGPYQGYRI